ncbi:MAG TPA: bifunctional alpha/beta hydrolase/OsmC family protein [Rhodothermales bacterium]|nr:bifunctional alpha/beta hydrolase/OsmC family protein [Rhodothermales bacterium]
MRFEKITFENDQGDVLAARLDLPIDGEPIAYALFAHCFTCTKNLNAVGNISNALTQRGIAVLRFDFTGLGESEGDFSDTNFSSNIDDLLAAAVFMEATYAAPTILVGHSLGGAAVLQAAHQLSSIKAVVTIGAPFDPEHVTHLFDTSLDEIEHAGCARVNLGGRPFTVKKQFIDDLKAQRVEGRLAALKRPLLIFHAPIDQTVGVENAALIFKAAKHPKSYISLDTADHLLSDPADSMYVGTVLAAWALKYVGARQAQKKHLDPKDNQVVVRLDAPGFRTEMLANGFPLVADEPLSVGGTNTGPTPYDYVVAGLGACTAMTLRMYAERKVWPLETVEVYLNHAKIHAEDCTTCTEKTGKVDQISRLLVLTGPLDDAQRARLLEIANRCPVHRTLESMTNITTDLEVVL